ncbi:hypothetical protein GRW23_22615, partial [Escherichia coli]|nr:hypothetical protein [Escherichia coli]
VMEVYSRVKANGTTEYTLVNKGTTATSLSNWKNNIEQLFGSSEDMKASIKNSKEFVKESFKQRNNYGWVLERRSRSRSICGGSE